MTRRFSGLHGSEQLVFSELPGIEPIPKMAVSCGDVKFGYAKVPEEARNDLRLRQRSRCHQAFEHCLVERIALVGAHHRRRCHAVIGDPHTDSVFAHE